jgi:hypothetical protein
MWRHLAITEQCQLAGGPVWDDVSLGASKPATHGRFKTSHPSRVITAIKSTFLNGCAERSCFAFFCRREPSNPPRHSVPLWRLTLVA